jgi:DNA-binding CsgD family transcriptional regulator
MREGWVIGAILLVQLICAVFFVSDIFASVVGLRDTPISWRMRELIELGAAFGLVLGVVLGGIALNRTVRLRRVAEVRLRAASGAFTDLLVERFAEWGLTPAEKDVALFAVKGLSTHEIANLRNTSEGTVKAQTNAIYRKAGVTGRPQLLSLFIEDMMQDDGRLRAVLGADDTAA